MSEIVAECIAPVNVPTTLLEVFTPIVNEARIHFDDDGIEMRAVDPANVAMHFVELDDSAFDAWDTPGTVTIGVNLESVVDRLGVADSNSMAKLSVDMETHRLHIDVENHNQQTRIIDPDTIRSEPSVLDLDLPNTVVLEARDVKSALSVAEMTSDHVELRADIDDETVSIFSQADVEESTTTWEREDTLEGTDVTETASSLFSLEFFTELTDPMPADAEVTMRFGEDFPVVMEWSALDGQMDAETILAPRIQST